jgi:hypothetical protein
MLTVGLSRGRKRLSLSTPQTFFGRFEKGVGERTDSTRTLTKWELTNAKETHRQAPISLVRQFQSQMVPDFQLNVRQCSNIGLLVHQEAKRFFEIYSTSFSSFFFLMLSENPPDHFLFRRPGSPTVIFGMEASIRDAKVRR